MIRIETRPNWSLSRAQKPGLMGFAPVFREHPGEIAENGTFPCQTGPKLTQIPTLSNQLSHPKPMQSP